jgi:hypothetical protein
LLKQTNVPRQYMANKTPIDKIDAVRPKLRGYISSTTKVFILKIRSSTN